MRVGSHDLGRRAPHSWRERLAEPYDVGLLVYFRVAFGLLAAWEMWRYLDHGWVETYFTDRAFYFKYFPFTFVDPLPEPWIQIVFWATGLAGVMVALGLFYRVAATALFAGLAYVFLLDQAMYLNHFYLIVLVAFLMIWVPANAAASVDARHVPGLRSDTVPAWSIWLLRFQVGVPYFFGGIAKLNSDWIQARPLRDWLAEATEFPLIGGLFVHDPVVWFMAWGSLLLDLLVVPALLYRRTRPWALLAAITFHLLNSRLFGIGVFPWFMLLATLMFLDPARPRQVLHDLRRSMISARSRGFLVGAAVGAMLGAFIPETVSPWKSAIAAVAVGALGYEFTVRGVPALAAGTQADERRATSRVSRTTAALLGVWVLVQVLVPLRHLVVPGDVHWSEEGHAYSWRMKLREKNSEAKFLVQAGVQSVEVDNDEFLSDRQERKMSSRPHMIVEYAHFLKEEYERRGFEDVEVHAEVWASLNGRPPRPLIDPAVDLAAQPLVWLGHAEWILLPEDTPAVRPGT